MKAIFFSVFVCIIPFFAKAQSISTFAGNGVMDNTNDGSPATAAAINYPNYGVFDKSNNFYFTTGVAGKTVRKITSTGTITTIAGQNGIGGFSGDGGMATLATFENPQGIAIDSVGNLLVCDAGDNRIRRIDHSTGIITTIAGDGSGSFGGDGGAATSAQIYDPNGICVDRKGNIYFADYGNNRVRRISTSGIISTFAGNGINGYGSDGGRADTSMIRGVLDICSDKYNTIYIADEANGRIRKVDTFGIIHTIAGNGIPGYSGDGGLATNAKITPHDITCDKYGNLFTCDIYEHKIRIINTSGYIDLLAGNGSAAYSGDGGLATGASLNGPHKVAIDTCGNPYFADLNNYRFRKITYAHCSYLDVKNISNSSVLSIYPNPVYNDLHIDVVSPSVIYYLYNLLGTVVQNGYFKSKSNSLNVSQLSQGVYLLHLVDDKGSRSIYKILKQ